MPGTSRYTRDKQAYQGQTGIPRTSRHTRDKQAYQGQAGIPGTSRYTRDKQAYQVMSENREFEKTILHICETRNDSLAVLVKGRIAYANDLHSADAI